MRVTDIIGTSVTETFCPVSIQDSVLTHVYNELGCHDISMALVSDFGCTDSAYHPLCRKGASTTKS